MLGAIGFFVLAIVVMIYAYTCFVQYVALPARERQLFVSGFSLLALTALVWMMTLFVTESAVAKMVFVSDVILVMSTICMLGLLIDITKPFVMTGVATVSAAMLMYRSMVEPPRAFVSDGGLLNFNLTQLEALIIGLMFLVIWLTATVRVVQRVFARPSLVPLRTAVTFVFMSTVLMTGFFLTARRPSIIVVSFVSIIMLFAVLVGVNMLVVRKSLLTTKERVHHGE